ncbi:MAG: bifunctional alpha/beta hydrolase/OsmC family protein [Arenicellales bacterium]|nr:bifunctional alpha/beta hydrolase/OsmC family protein [Arenicellales bacterium]
MSSQRLKFPGTHGELDARFDLPTGPPRAFALFAHCFTCSKDTVAASRVSRALAARGIAVLRFDFTGLGGSDGDFANTNFSSNIEDLIKAAEFLRQRGNGPSILVGHSLGGAAVLSAASRIPECKAVVTIGAPSDPGHVQHLFADSVDQIAAEGEQEVILAGRKFVIRKQFLEDIAAQKLSQKIHRLNRALLVMHSPQDDIVDIDHARRIYEAALHPKSFISLDKSDHLLNSKRDAEYAAEVIGAWVNRYLPIGEEDDAASADRRRVVVAEAGVGRFTQHVTIGPHHLIADEPKSHGGQDSGPTPYDLLLTALGACTNMTVRMYADRKQLPLKHVEVQLVHDKIHATDCEHCETKDGRIDRIQTRVSLTGELNREQRRRLLEIADKCPVHRTLRSEVLIEDLETT